MTAGMGLRTLAQTVVFLIVARVLGVADYGPYAAVLALSTAFGCFSGWGAQVLMVRDVSRNLYSFAAAWARTIAAIVMSSPILFALYIPFAWAVLPAGISLTVIALIGLADLVFAPIGLSAVTAFQGHDLHGRVALLSLLPVLPRLAGAIALIPLAIVLPDVIRLKIWAALYALAALASTLYAGHMARKDLGPAGKPDQLLGLKPPKEKKSPGTARLLKRLQKVERLHATDRRVLLKMLDSLVERHGRNSGI